MNFVGRLSGVFLQLLRNCVWRQSVLARIEGVRTESEENSDMSHSTNFKNNFLKNFYLFTLYTTNMQHSLGSITFSFAQVDVSHGLHLNKETVIHTRWSSAA